MRVTFFYRNVFGSDYYRAILPMNFCDGNRKFHAEGLTPVDILQQTKNDLKKLSENISAHCLLIPRAINLDIWDKVQSVLNDRYDTRIINDHDDNVFDVSPWSPHYERFGTKEYATTNKDGKVIPLRVDGVNVNIKENLKHIDHLKKCIEKANVITVTTDELAKVYKQYNRNVKVLPNCVDMRLWQKLPLPKSEEEVRLFWAGGHSHYEDWYLLKDVMPEVMKKHPNVKLVLMGRKWDYTLRGIDPNRIEYHGWEDYGYHYKVRILNPDIGLIPLRDTKFNRCKSPIKWIEMGAMEVPCVSSYLPPYSKMSELSDNNGVYIADNDPELWIKGISELITNKELRLKIGRQAYETVSKHFDINTQYKQWVKVYKEAVLWRHQQPPLNRLSLVRP